MEPAALDYIIAEVGDVCWRCGGNSLYASYEPIVGAIVICNNCGHEHYFTHPIQNVPTNL